MIVLQQSSVHRVETVRVHLEHVHRAHGHRLRYNAIRLYLGEIANASQQAIDNSRRSAGPAGNLARAARFDRQVQDPG